MKPGFGRPPVTFDGRGSNAHYVCCLFDGEAAKVPQLNHACFLLVEICQSFERVVQRDQFSAAVDGPVNVFIQGEFLKILSTFFRIVLARMINQQASHYLCSNSKKMSAILPVHPCLIDESQVSLMNQSSRLQSVIWAFTSQIIRRELTEFIVDDG